MPKRVVCGSRDQKEVSDVRGAGHFNSSSNSNSSRTGLP